MKSRVRLTNEQREQLSRDYKENISVEVLMARFNVSRNTVCSILKQFDARSDMSFTDLELKSFPIAARDIFSTNRKNKSSMDDFSTWMKRKILQYKLVQNIDYLVKDVYLNTSGRGGNYAKEYRLTIKVAGEMIKGLEAYIIKSKANTLYFIYSQVLNLVKIGVTTDIRRRFQDIQLCSPVPLRILKTVEAFHAVSIESKLHKQFKDLNSHGEWFRFEDELKQYIDRI